MKTYKTPIGALASAIVTTQALTKASKEWGGHSEEFERGFCLALDIVKKSIEDSICPDEAERFADELDEKQNDANRYSLDAWPSKEETE